MRNIPIGDMTIDRLRIELANAYEANKLYVEVDHITGVSKMGLEAENARCESCHFRQSKEEK
jgi:hypothetical protein